MKPYYADEAVTLYHGDNRDVIATLPANSVDAVVTDPPYELGFMGRRWDSSGIAYNVDLWADIWRVLKPGGHLLAFGGTRTWHRLACAIEDAGFEVRDSIAWMYGSGFPKSSRVSRDERFCHCDANGRTSSHTSPEQGTGDHTRTGETSAPAVGASGSAPSELQTTQDSLAGCHPERGSDGVPPRRVPEGVQFSVPSQGCAPARSRSAEPEDGRDAEQGRSPFPAPRSVLPSMKDSRHPSMSDSDVSARTQGSTSPADTSELAAGTQGSFQDSSWSDYATGLPVCSTCGKPDATGWGTALKPAFEPVVVARKPLIGTVAANVLAHGTGALNVDGARIGMSEADRAHIDGRIWIGRNGYKDGKEILGDYATDGTDQTMGTHPAGRWPANVILDESQAEALDRQSGVLPPATSRTKRPDRGPFSTGHEPLERDEVYGDTGGASRFFYTAKATSAERPRVAGVAHPTVKPLDLMRWLVRLVTPPGGTVLDPFAGSGTTLEAAIVEGFRCVGIEREADYLPLITQRIDRAHPPLDFGASA